MNVKHKAAVEKGVVNLWQDDKGFGFIQSESGEEVFFHINDYNAQQRPRLDEQVLFTLAQDAQGRACAIQVQPLVDAQQKMAQKNQQIRKRNQRKSQQMQFESGQKKRLLMGLGFYGVLVLLAVMHKLPWLIVAWYVVIGVVTFLVYGKDKKAAQNNQWRTPEATLHLLSIAGGWVGAMVAQTYLRHKSQKPEFRLMYYLTVVSNMAGLLFLLIRFSGAEVKGWF